MTKLQSLLEIVARLRGPEGCPWDRAQTLSSLCPYLLEEGYEVVEAVEAATAPAAPEAAVGRLRDELGDLLFVVSLLARTAEEAGLFSLEDASEAAVAKMIRRHPHVFSGAEEADPGSIAAWEARKAVERGGTRRGTLDGVPRALPSLLRAHRQGEKASGVGFDWPDRRGVLAKIREELAELEEALEGTEDHPASPDPAVMHEYGDLLLATAELGRFVGVTGEEALRRANDRFANRFRAVEALAEARGQRTQDLDLDALEALWAEAKRALQDAPPTRSERGD